MVEEEQVSRIATELYHYPNVQHLSEAQARERATPFGGKTEFGSLNFVSNVRNRSAGLTVYIGSEKVQQRKLSARQKEIIANAPETLARVYRYLDRAPMVAVRQTMGDNPYFNPHCTLYVSTYFKYAVQLPHMWGQTLPHYRPSAPGPEQTLIYVPEWPEAERQILVFPERSVTFVLGSDYMGEAKKGHLRMAMWNAKQAGMLGVHAGAKILQVRSADGKVRRYSMLLFGLSATGKTTHSCHDHGLRDHGESIAVVQDDVVFLRQDGSALGTERGFYLKTEGLNEETQPILYRAATQPRTIFENAMVDSEGHVDFDDETITSNGRGVVQMADLVTHAHDSINLPPVDELDGLIFIFITRRNTVLPICSRLTLEQAAVTFMLGESVESSAGDPRRAGESVRVTGTNPFIVGDDTEEGNWIFSFMKAHGNKVQAYLINTGGVGEVSEKLEDGTRRVHRAVTRISLDETPAVFRAIVRDKVEWEQEPYFGTMVPKRVEGMDMSKFDPANFYSQSEIDALVAELNADRRKCIEQFTGLDPAIVKALK